jgi:small-conductance mechanosensitive channel
MLDAITKHYLMPAVYIVLVLLAGLVFHWLFFGVVRRLSRRESALLSASLARHMERPSRFFFPLLFAAGMAPLVSLAGAAEWLIPRALRILLYWSAAWLLIQSISVLGDLVKNHYRIDHADNLHQRKVVTQLQYIKRVIGVIVVIVTLAFTLLQFPHVRELGAGLLTSAGIAGIIIGFAAQKTIGNLLAGFQIAFTQPIRIDDVVVVEGEWGRIEEITLTYVVARIWDQRRLVLPLNYFIETPFQNWTRTSAELLGSVFFHVDYRMPIEPLREEMTRILRSTPLWDGRVNVIHVTDAKTHTLEIRALASARDASSAWDLRCLLREKLIAFIQREYPQGLPRARVEMEGLRGDVVD